jgi:Endonuclease-reverse transcriptase
MKTTSNKANKAKKDDMMQIMLVNCRSICNKIDEFRTLLEVHKPEVIVAVETWLDDGYQENELTIDGYVFHRRDRNKHGGGIMVGTKNGVNGNVTWREETVEMMGMEIKVKKHTFTLIAAYRPPNDDVTMLNRLADRLSDIRMDDNVIIAGDMNLPNVKWEAGGGGNCKQSIVHDIMNEGFTQAVQEGTRETRTGRNNILDVILIRPEELWVSSKVIEGISDHKIPVVSLLISSDEKETEKKKVWYYKQARKEPVKCAFQHKYANEWKNKNMPDIQTMWMEFRTIYNDIRQEFIPSKVIRSNSDPVYYDKKVKKLKRRCRKIHKMKTNKNTFLQQEKI